MSCKNSGWNNCGCSDNKKWENVCYYKCKDNGCGSKKCKKEIEETKGLIDDGRDKNNDLGKDLKDALDNQKYAKDAVKGIEDNIDNLAKNLEDIQKALLNAAKDLADMSKDIEAVIPAQQAAIDDIKAAKDKQKDLKGIFDDIDNSFEDTIKCLTEKAGHPILIPWDDECDKPCKHDCECDC
ncbi:MAG: hypothetical protein ACRCYC_10640 [Paraclostridium sp.]|uniref:hypothetical protein n=1 Tax=Paraclostridium sp. TaxID=2023273 RepID=UPI003F38497F